jgi:hypothetical protein
MRKTACAVYIERLRAPSFLANIRPNLALLFRTGFRPIHSKYKHKIAAFVRRTEDYRIPRLGNTIRKEREALVDPRRDGRTGFGSRNGPAGSKPCS